MSIAWRWFLLLTLVFSLAGLSPKSVEAVAFHKPALQGGGLAMVSPAACPSTGCAPGQRMNLRFDFELSTYFPSDTPNVKVCIYAPTSWALIPDTNAVIGELTGKEYAPPVDGNCAEDTVPPTGYTRIAALEAAINQTAFSDAIPLAFRFSTTATGKGQIVARLFERGETTPFTRTQQSTTTILSPAALAKTVYVATDASGCGSNSPCFLNSADDLPDGLGTGLRDAIQAVADESTINILGTYLVKTNTVVIDKPLTVSGISDALITNAATGVCDPQPVLSLRDAVTLQNLNINDGACAAPGRSLVEVNSSKNVNIMANDLMKGDNAIYIRDNSGAVTIRNNRINGNTGYAVYEEGNKSGAALDVTANNLNGNRSGGAIDCSATASDAIANRKANHNYWGGAAPASNTSHCTIAAGKRLGLPILLKTNAPGVDAQLVKVVGDKTYAFDSSIAYRRNGGTDFSLFIINHGYMAQDGAPFTYAAGGDSPSPCSNYWDVFLPDGITPTGILELSFKYDKTAGCLAAINSNKYCDQTTTIANYPLFWYDPATNATKWWDTTGQRPENLTSGDGQPTSCNISANEIQVSLDTSGRPSLTGDLFYTPFMVGIPILRTFLPLASSQNITITWTTNNEPDVDGFYVLRSLDGVNYSPISDLIPRRGSALVGIITPPYSFVDQGRVNGVSYHYRLQILRTDGYSIYSADYAISANIATITPTRTITPTFTRTVPRPTNTLAATRIPVSQPTRIPTWTFTPRPISTTVTPFVLKTSTPFGQPTSTFDPFATLDETQIALATQGTPAYPFTGSETSEVGLSGTPSPEATAVPMLDTATPRPTPSETIFPAATTDQGARPGPWISLLLGLITSLGIIGSIGGWWYFRTRG